MNAAKSLAATAIACLSVASHAALTEGFDDVSTLAASGWVITNLSTPVGGVDWFQGNEGVFVSQSGAANSYVASNFEAADSKGGSVDNWLISPVLTLAANDTLSFSTKVANAGFHDVLEVLFSSGSGSSTSGFTTTLLTIGDDYPTDWTNFSLTLPTAATGRFAFRYLIDDTVVDGSYIGIDSVRVAATVPEPSTFALAGLGLVAVALARRGSKRRVDASTLASSPAVSL